MAPETTLEFSRRCRHCGETLDPASSFCSKCGATAETPGTKQPSQLRDQLQNLFGQDLDIEREIGRGGMAAVFAGFDPALQRRVAIKVLLPEIANDRSSADRFLREARTVASLQHPHVVTVYAVKSRDGVHAIVMQFVEGRSLDATLHERGSLTLPVAGLLLAQSCDGLQHAHERGVIHRDVKPANVLIETDGRAIVSDFGIARRESGPRTTETGLVVGTWAYMSPEQRAADNITAATDQYALGVMAFELLTGKLPFTGTPGQVMQGHMHEPPPSLRAIRPNISEQLEAVIHRMLAKDPAKRFPSLREPERAFRALVDNVGQTTLQLAAYSKIQEAKSGSQVVAAVARPTTPSVVQRAEAPTKRTTSVPVAEPIHATHIAAKKRSNGGVLVGVGAGVVVLVAGWLLMKGRDKPARPTAETVPAATAPATLQPASPQVNAGGSQQKQAANTAEQQRPAAGNAGGTQPNIGGAVVPRGLNATSAESPASKAPVQSLPTTDPASPPERPAAKSEPAPTPSAPALPAAAVADARKLGRDFVTMLNQHRYRDLALVPNAGGDGAARAELLRLTEREADFSAGFDRLPSAPTMSPQGFETEFDLDLQWRGGKKLMRVLLYAIPADGGWKLAGMAISPAG